MIGALQELMGSQELAAQVPKQCGWGTGQWPIYQYMQLHNSTCVQVAWPIVSSNTSAYNGITYMCILQSTTNLYSIHRAGYGWKTRPTWIILCMYVLSHDQLVTFLSVNCCIKTPQTNILPFVCSMQTCNRTEPFNLVITNTCNYRSINSILHFTIIVSPKIICKM